MRKLSTQSAEQEARRAADALAQLIAAVPPLSCQFIPQTLTSGSTVRVRHRLNRPWVGCIQAALFNAAGPGYFYSTHGALDKDFIEVTAVGYDENPVLLLWVF
jgi:hypothetical protein